MNKGIAALLVSAMMLTFSALPAMADNDRGKGNRGNNFRQGRGFDDRRDFNRFFNQNPYGGVSAAAVAAFDSRAGQVRADISARLAAGAISAAQAARLNARLDSLLNLRAQYGSSGGVLTGTELARLNSQLNDLRVAIRNRVFF